MATVAVQRHQQSTRRLTEAAQYAPIDAVEAAARALGSVAKHHERSPFVAWVLKTLVDNEIADLEELVEVLARPEVLADVRQRDPLARARLRGLRAKQQLLEAEGGSVSGRELAQALGMTRQAVDKRRLNNTLIGIDFGKRGYAYPVWQVGLRGLDAVLAELAEYDPWTQALFMLSANSWLDGETPLAVLRRGDLHDVVAAARLYGEQTAA